MSPAQLRIIKVSCWVPTASVLIYDPEHPGKPKYDNEAIKSIKRDMVPTVDIIDFYDLQESAEEYEENHRQENSILMNFK